MYLIFRQEISSCGLSASRTRQLTAKTIIHESLCLSSIAVGQLTNQERGKPFQTIHREAVCKKVINSKQISDVFVDPSATNCFPRLLLLSVCPRQFSLHSIIVHSTQNDTPFGSLVFLSRMTIRKKQRKIY